MISLVGRYFGASRVCVHDAEGSGPRLQELLRIQDLGKPVQCGELEGVLRGLVQVDWGDFALLDDAVAAPAFDWAQDLAGKLLAARALVRAVDDEFFYVYSKPDPGLAEFLNGLDGFEGFTVGSADELDYPG